MAAAAATERTTDELWSKMFHAFSNTVTRSRKLVLGEQVKLNVDVKTVTWTSGLTMRTITSAFQHLTIWSELKRAIAAPVNQPTIRNKRGPTFYVSIHPVSAYVHVRAYTVNTLRVAE